GAWGFVALCRGVSGAGAGGAGVTATGAGEGAGAEGRGAAATRTGSAGFFFTSSTGFGCSARTASASPLVDVSAAAARGGFPGPPISRGCEQEVAKSASKRAEAESRNERRGHIGSTTLLPQTTRVLSDYSK